MNDNLLDKGITEAIFSEEGVETDHLTVFSRFRMPRVPSYNIEKYTYFHMTAEGHEAFGKALSRETWDTITECTDVNRAVDNLQAFFQKTMEVCYEKKTRKKKSSEPNWMTDWLRDEIEDRRKVFKTDEGRSDRWKVLKRRVARQVKKRKEKNDEFILQKFEEETNPGKFFHHLQSLMSNQVKERWSPFQMYPGEGAKEIAEKLAVFFNSISSQYPPLELDKIPQTYSSPLPELSEEQVSKRIKASKNPRQWCQETFPLPSTRFIRTC